MALPTAGQRRDLPSLALFLVTSVLISVVAGFGLGWWLMLYQTFGVPLPAAGWLGLVQVHGHAQLMGFAGLLVMGIGFRLLPRFRAAAPSEQRVVLGTFACVAVGVALRTAQLAEPSAPRTLLLAASASLELAGAFLYATTVIRVLASGDNAHRSDELVMASGAAWLPVAAMWNAVSLLPVLRGGSLAAPDADAAVVAALLVGAVGGHILGVSIRVNSGFIAAKLVPDRVVLAATVLWTLGTFLLVVGVGLGAALLLAAAATLFVTVGAFGRSRAARPLPEHARVTLFAFRSAYSWLVVGLTFLTLDALTPDGSHPLVVAGRHALAIGFLAPMAFGVGARLLPTLTGGTALSPAAVRWAISLANVAAVLRAGVEVIGPSTPPAAVALALSGPVGLAALLVFASAAARTVRSTSRAFG